MRLVELDPAGRLRGPTAWLLIVLLMAVGALAAAAWAERDERRSLEDELARATDESRVTIEQFLDEFVLLAQSLSDRSEPDCSAEMLEQLRRSLFGLDYMRDIGIVRNRTLYCSTTLGVIENPVVSSAPDLIIGDGIALYAYRSVRLSLNRPTMVLSAPHMNALVDPVLIQSLIRPPWMEALQVSDATGSDWFALYGEPGDRPVGPPGEDQLVQVQCSDLYSFCVRGLRALPPLIGTISTQRSVFIVLGAIAGLAVFLAIQLVTLAYCTPTMRLRRALSSGAIKARYQPIFDAYSGRLISVETLARWPRGPVFLRSPEAFVSVAEEGGLAQRLTQRMIENVGRELGDWLAERRDISVALNISAQDLDGDVLERTLEAQLLARGMVPQQVVLEITERSLLGVHAPIERLVDRGYSVHVDDFGEGYSSLAYLHELPLQGIKISRTFVSSLGCDSPKAALVTSMVQMAEQLKLHVVLEGIETERQRQAVVRLGSVSWQGFLFARPMSASSLRAFEAALEGESVADTA